MKNRLRNLALAVALISAVALGWMERADAARIPLGGLTTLNLSTHLDPQFVELYDLRETFKTPGYAAAAPKFVTDANSNMGHGVAALSAWVSSAKAIEFSFTTFGQDSNGAAFVSFNAYESAAGVWKYKSADDASLQTLRNDGAIVIQRAAPGAAGGTITWSTVATIDNGLVSNSGGVGYGTGAGGTVTQTTSKSTAVTLNKASGQITLNNASLAANTAVTFTLNNSLLAAGDTLVVHVYGATSGAGNYSARPSGGAAGSIGIVVKNESASTLSDVVVISFAIVKVATS